MEKYEVVVRNRPTANRWSMIFSADDFAHAEEQAKDITDQQQDEEIIEIKKDYDDSSSD